VIRPLLVVLAILVLAAGCNNAGAAGSASVEASPASATLTRDEAARLLARGEYAAAEAQYRLALRTEPEDVVLRYGLGTALSHLDRTEETRTEFEWVVAHADRTREEYRGAQHWLRQLVTAASSAQATTIEEKPSGSMKGKTSWPGITPETPIMSLELRLNPEESDGGARPLKHHIRLGSPYTFSKIPPGAYQLVARVEGYELWKRRVEITADTETTVDLTADTSLLPPAQFTPTRFPPAKASTQD
jgi:hypothetical protein